MHSTLYSFFRGDSGVSSSADKRTPGTEQETSGQAQGHTGCAHSGRPFHQWLGDTWMVTWTKVELGPLLATDATWIRDGTI